MDFLTLRLPLLAAGAASEHMVIEPGREATQLTECVGGFKLELPFYVTLFFPFLLLLLLLLLFAVECPQIVEQILHKYI